MILSNTYQNNLEQKLSPMELAEAYGFERHQMVWSCTLPNSEKEQNG